MWMDGEYLSLSARTSVCLERVISVYSVCLPYRGPGRQGRKGRGSLGAAWACARRLACEDERQACARVVAAAAVVAARGRELCRRATVMGLGGEREGGDRGEQCAQHRRGWVWGLCGEKEGGGMGIWGTGSQVRGLATEQRASDGRIE